MNTDLAAQIDAVLAQAKEAETRTPNRKERREFMKHALTRKQRQQSKARTNERLGWAQPKKG